MNLTAVDWATSGGHRTILSIHSILSIVFDSF